MSVEIVDFELAEVGIAGLLVVTMKQVTDERGTVRELFRRSAFERAGVRLAPFQQINVTETHRGVIRGMHAEATAKLVTVAAGEALGAYVDLRPASPTFGTVHTAMLRPGTQVLVPIGVANGFQALADATQYAYCFDAEWAPGMPGLACDPLDPELGIAWPLPVDRGDPAQISVKDRDAPSFASIREGLRS
jgi:dTDP-4-dehydrorhamnose 3,5-epimerase